MSDLGQHNREHFDMVESADADGCVRLNLAGELDIDATPRVTARVMQLLAAGTSIRIELADLTFMDSTGFQCLWDAVRQADRSGCTVTVGDQVGGQVRRVIGLLNGERLLWPGR